jgi:eukaryotic-like serine/threonine-protein kinase
VQFTQMRLPDDTEVAFDGLALDRGDKKPGLAASARVAPSGGSGEESLGTKVARGTGNVLLNTVTGGVAQDVGRGAGSTIVNNRQSDSSAGGGSSAILLDSGVLFDVFVSRSF